MFFDNAKRSFILSCTNICLMGAGDREIAVQEEWKDVLADLTMNGGTLYVIGATDHGKSTFCRYVLSVLATGRTIAYLDCDTGQSVIGPPTTLGLALYKNGSTRPVSVHLRFTGSTSPRGHFLEFLTGAKRLHEKAQSLGSYCTVIDSPGYIKESAAQEFHFQMIDLIRPDHIIAIQKFHELETVLANFSKNPLIRIHRFSVPLQAKSRSSINRQRYREQQFRDYFAGATCQALPFEGLGLHGHVPTPSHYHSWRNLLVALSDCDQMVITLAIVRRTDSKRKLLMLFSPPFDAKKVACVHVGSITLDLSKCKED